MFKMRYALVACLMAVPAVGTTINYTASGSTWNSQVQSGTSSSLGFSSGGPWNSSGGYNDGGYIFTGPDGSGWSLASKMISSTQGLVSAEDGVGSIELTLPGAGKSAIFITAEAINNSNVLEASDALTVTLYDGSTAMTPYTYTGGMLGINASFGITSVLIQPTKSNEGVFLTYLNFANSSLPQDGGSGGGNGDPPPAPEAITFALVGGGLLILFGAKRKFPDLTKFAS